MMMAERENVPHNVVCSQVMFLWNVAYLYITPEYISNTAVAIKTHFNTVDR